MAKLIFTIVLMLSFSSYAGLMFEVKAKVILFSKKEIKIQTDDEHILLDSNKLDESTKKELKNIIKPKMIMLPLDSIKSRIKLKR